MIQNLLVFAIVVFLVGLLSRYQIIENGVIGIIVGVSMHTYFKWHPLFCILIGVAAVGSLFLISRIKIGFWIKTILFSGVVTFMVFMCIYSDVGLFPLPDNIWKTAFVIIFFLENILIRYTVKYNSEDSQFCRSENIRTKTDDDLEGNQNECVKAQIEYNEHQAINSKIAEINNFVRKMNAEILKEQKGEDGESDAYLMNRVYLFYQKKSLWDGKPINNVTMEEKVYSELKAFIDKEYLILPHVAFREIFGWGEWKNDPKLTDRVTKMHFDFGVYNKELQPIFFMEVQGKEHKENPNAIARDTFKAEITKRCGMKLVTMDCSEYIPDTEIRDKVIACIKKEIPDRESYAVYCPNCRKQGKNSLMEIKLNKDNVYFYGCSTYKPEQANCPGISIEDVPPLYYGIPLFNDKEK